MDDFYGGKFKELIPKMMPSNIAVLLGYLFESTTLLATMTLTGQYSTSNQLGHRTAHHDSHQPVEIPSMFLGGVFFSHPKKMGVLCNITSK